MCTQTHVHRPTNMHMHTHAHKKKRKFIVESHSQFVPAILAHKKLRQEDYCQFKPSLGYTVSTKSMRR